MIINNKSSRIKELVADEGKLLHKIGTDSYFTRILLSQDADTSLYEEVDKESRPKYTEDEYQTEVNARIRAKYSLDEELAIKRKVFNTIMFPDTTFSNRTSEEAVMEEYANFNNFIEACKQEAKDFLNNRESDIEV